MFANVIIAMPKGGAAGTPVGIFAGGYNGAAMTVTDKYSFSTFARSAGTSLSTARYVSEAFSTYTNGYINGGSGGASTVEKYKFSDDTISSGTSMPADRSWHGAANNSTVGVLGGGDSPGRTSTSTKLTFSGETWGSATSLTIARDALGGTSTSTTGYFVGGIDSGGFEVSGVDKYTFGDGTKTASTALDAVRSYAFPCGNTTQGVFCGTAGGAQSASTSKITYSSDATAAGASLTTSNYARGGTGDPTNGIFAGGHTFITTADKYVHSGNTTSATNSLGTARGYIAGASGTPGGF